MAEIDTPTDTVLEIIADDDGTMHLAPYSTTDCLAMSVTGIPHRSALSERLDRSDKESLQLHSTSKSSHLTSQLYIIL